MIWTHAELIWLGAIWCAGPLGLALASQEMRRPQWAGLPIRAQVSYMSAVMLLLVCWLAYTSLLVLATIGG